MHVARFQKNCAHRFLFETHEIAKYILRVHNVMEPQGMVGVRLAQYRNQLCIAKSFLLVSSRLRNCLFIFKKKYLPASSFSIKFFAV